MRWLGGLLATVVLPLLLEILKEWSPRLAQNLIRRAARWLPESHQERYEEEWLAELENKPAGISRLLMAIWFVSSLPLINRALRSPQSRKMRLIDFIALDSHQSGNVGSLRQFELRLLAWTLAVTLAVAAGVSLRPATQVVDSPAEPPLSSPLRFVGELTLGPGGLVDLDSGNTVWDQRTVGYGADLYYRALLTRAGVQAAPSGPDAFTSVAPIGAGHTTGSLPKCLSSLKEGVAPYVPIDQLTPGYQLCVETGEKHWALLTVVARHDARLLRFKVVVWEKP